MAAKAVRIASGDITYLPITTSDLVQMNGTTQSLTTYINNIKNSVSNTAKVGWYYDNNTDDKEDVYAYVGPNGTQADVTNGVGSAIHFKAKSNIDIYYSDGAFNIGAFNDKVNQSPMSNINSSFPLLTKYTNANTDSETSYTHFSGTSTNIFAYVNPAKKILYSKHSYSDEFTEKGQKLFNKYTTYAYINSKLSNVTGKLDFTVVRSVMDDITII